MCKRKGWSFFLTKNGFTYNRTQTKMRQIIFKIFARMRPAGPNRMKRKTKHRNDTENPNPMQAKVRCDQCFEVLVATEVRFNL